MPGRYRACEGNHGRDKHANDNAVGTCGPTGAAEGTEDESSDDHAAACEAVISSREMWALNCNGS
jgi:hypothetical protein